MSICSAHRTPQSDCELCHATPEDLFGKEVWEEACRRAKTAGTRKCVKCKFEFYRTTELCPLCGKDHSGID